MAARRSLPAWLLALPLAVVLVAGLIAVAARAGDDGGDTTSGAASTPSESPTPSATSMTSAADLLASSLAAAKQAGSVHIDLTHRAGGRTAHYVDDDAATSGVQRITISPDLRVEIRVAGKTTYVRANGPALVKFLRFPIPPSVATTAAGTWIELKPGDPRYVETTAGITLDSALSQFALGGSPLTLEPHRTIDGVPVVGVTGPIAPSLATEGRPLFATLWVRADGPPLPVAYIGHLGDKTSFHATFSAWGTPVHVAAPGHPMSFADLVHTTPA